MPFVLTAGFLSYVEALVIRDRIASSVKFVRTVS